MSGTNFVDFVLNKSQPLRKVLQIILVFCQSRLVLFGINFFRNFINLHFYQNQIAFQFVVGYVSRKGLFEFVMQIVSLVENHDCPSQMAPDLLQTLVVGEEVVTENDEVCFVEERVLEKIRAHSVVISQLQQIFNVKLLIIIFFFFN